MPADSMPQIAIDLSHLKRTTCDLCRERKVKCDRTKPECQRCQRARHRCTYPSAEGEATKLNSTLQTLHARLMRAERQLRQQDCNTARDISDPSFTNQSQFTAIQEHSCMSPTMDDVPGDFAPWDHSMYFGCSDANSLDRPADTNSPRRLSEYTTAISSLHNNFLSDLWPAEIVMDNPISISDASEDPTPQLTTKTTARNIQQCEQMSRDSMDAFFDTYFSVVQRHLPLIDRDRFLSSTIKADNHQSQALRCAVAMSGASSLQDGEVSASLYKEARLHMERAQTEVDNSSFLNLETAQAMVLIARFEFPLAKQRALLTLASLMQLLTLLGYDRLDGKSADRESPFIEEKRCTFWIAFCMHCNASGTIPHVLSSMPNEILTLLSSQAGHSLEHLIPFSIHGKVTPTTTDTLNAFSLFILSLRLVLQTNQHQRMTASNIAGTGALEYNFCLAHERIDTSINAILSALMSPASSSVLDSELQVLALLMTLGARIQLHKTAILNAQKAEFLAPVVRECERMGVMTANTMSDILLQVESFGESQVPVYRSMSLFIMPPLAMAAEIQLCVLKQGAKEIAQNMNMFYTNREIRHSLETICMAMGAFKGRTDQYDGLINRVQTFLERTQLGKRLNSEFQTTTRGPSAHRRRTSPQTEDEPVA